MSFPPPYRSGSRVWKTLAGLERAVERHEGKFAGFTDCMLVVEWPAGSWEYPVQPDPDGGTRVELQLEYDLRP